MGLILDCLCGSNIGTWVLTRSGQREFDYRQRRRRCDRSRERAEDTPLLALEIEEGAMSHGMQGIKE